MLDGIRPTQKNVMFSYGVMLGGKPLCSLFWSLPMRKNICLGLKLIHVQSVILNSRSSREQRATPDSQPCKTLKMMCSI
jgi:hypothetical protein